MLSLLSSAFLLHESFFFFPSLECFHCLLALLQFHICQASSQCTYSKAIINMQIWSWEKISPCNNAWLRYQKLTVKFSILLPRKTFDSHLVSKVFEAPSTEWVCYWTLRLHCKPNKEAPLKVLGSGGEKVFGACDKNPRVPKQWGKNKRHFYG